MIGGCRARQQFTSGVQVFACIFAEADFCSGVQTTEFEIVTPNARHSCMGCRIAMHRLGSEPGQHAESTIHSCKVLICNVLADDHRPVCRGAPERDGGSASGIRSFL